MSPFNMLLHPLRSFNSPMYAEAGRYKSRGCISDFQKSIKCVAVSPNNILSVGGRDGISFYRLSTFRKLPAAQHDVATRGVVTALAWLTNPDGSETMDTVCFGTSRGWLAIWQQIDRTGRFGEVCAECVGGAQEIISVTADTTDSNYYRFAIGNRHRVVQTWTLRDNVHLEAAFSIKLEKTIPMSIIFDRDSDPSDLLVFGAYDGAMKTLCAEDGRVLTTIMLDTHIGHAALSSAGDKIAVDCASDCIRVYSSTGIPELGKGFTNVPIKSVPKQVAWGEQDRIIVVGSDLGLMYVFDALTKEKVDVLHHCKDGLVQVVTTHESGGSSMIIGATSDDSKKKPFVSIWVKVNKGANARQIREVIRTAWKLFRALRFLIHCIMIVLFTLVSVAIITEYYPLQKSTDVLTIGEPEIADDARPKNRFLNTFVHSNVREGLQEPRWIRKVANILGQLIKAQD